MLKLFGAYISPQSSLDAGHGVTGLTFALLGFGLASVQFISFPLIFPFGIGLFILCMVHWRYLIFFLSFTRAYSSVDFESQKRRGS